MIPNNKSDNTENNDKDYTADKSDNTENVDKEDTAEKKLCFCY